MTNRSGAPVVVAVDGSTSALEAVRVAAREAATRRPAAAGGARVHLAALRRAVGTGAGRSAGRRIPPPGGAFVAEAVTEAGKVAPELAVTGTVVDGAADAGAADRGAGTRRCWCSAAGAWAASAGC